VLLGTIAELFETGANDVMVVKPCKGSVDQEERWIPWHPSTVQQIDLTAQRMDVNWGVDY
jgi:16S rRNA processing protein RimM